MLECQQRRADKYVSFVNIIGIYTSKSEDFPTQRDPLGRLCLSPDTAHLVALGYLLFFLGEGSFVVHSFDKCVRSYSVAQLQEATLPCLPGQLRRLELCSGNSHHLAAPGPNSACPWNWAMQQRDSCGRTYWDQRPSWMLVLGFEEVTLFGVRQL